MLCCAGTVFANVYYVISLCADYGVALLLVFVAGFIRACFGKSATFKMAVSGKKENIGIYCFDCYHFLIRCVKRIYMFKTYLKM